VDNVYAGWDDDKILLRVNHQNQINSYNLHSFVGSINNDLEITDMSDKNKPIHISIDVIDDDKTYIVIENA
jgi:hypothetical protein